MARIRRMRPSNKGKRFMLPIGMGSQNRVSTSEIQSFRGASKKASLGIPRILGASFDAHDCSTVVAQTKGKDKTPVVVIWHARPMSVPDAPLIDRNRLAEPLRETPAEGREKALREELLEKLRAGTRHALSDAQFKNPEVVADAITTYLNEVRGHGKGSPGRISVTLIPGYYTVGTPNAYKSMVYLRRIFQGQRRRGMITNLRSRGLKTARGTGASTVAVTETGRIHRGRHLYERL